MMNLTISPRSNNSKKCQRGEKSPILSNKTRASSLFIVSLILSLIYFSSALMSPTVSFQYFWHKHNVRNSAVKSLGAYLEPNKDNSKQAYASTPTNSSTVHVDSTKMSSKYNKKDEIEIETMLRKYGFGNRVISLSQFNLSKCFIPAEIYDDGSWKLCLVTGLRCSSSSQNAELQTPPLFDVLVMTKNGSFEEQKVIDVGQITTLWTDLYNVNISGHSLQSAFTKSQHFLQNNILHLEKLLQQLYNSRIFNRSRLSFQDCKALTKRDIKRIASISTNPSHVEGLLRNLLKVGQDRVSRLVDSSSTSKYLFSSSSHCEDNEILRRMVAAEVLTEDASTGGRFRRRSCQFVSIQYSHNVRQDHDSNIHVIEREVVEVTLVNGGWIAVDPSLKAGTEGRKFASLGKDHEKYCVNDSRVFDAFSIRPRALTEADERIALRLECLAMGDIWREDDCSSKNQESSLEVDVREALSNMNLPLTAEGARDALIKVGRWTHSYSNSIQDSRGIVEHWPPDVLRAAKTFAQYESRQRESLAKACTTATDKNMPNFETISSHKLEGRINLSSLPCVCIDAKRTTFRDDSIGIRLRSSTGRKVNEAASKWEVLVHIADVSGVYFGAEKVQNSVDSCQEDLNFKLLRESAKRRGQSRYDLPMGPLHLLPPVALEALSLVTNNEGLPNKCVTLWAYIDERNGKLLDAGLERTITSSPQAMSFADATALLSCNVRENIKDSSIVQSILLVAERHLRVWSLRHQQYNQAAQKRERRLATKELIATELKCNERDRDDGVGKSFQRSRGHRLVDSSLDLYAFALGALMKRANQPIPRAVGSGADRGGRLGTAPLRRYIDGLAQRQAVSVLCGYGTPLSLNDCREAAMITMRASDRFSNLRSVKNVSRPSKCRNQVLALHKLNQYMFADCGVTPKREFKAISTGVNNEIVIMGVGAIAKLKGVQGTIKGGEMFLVKVVEINPEKDVLDVQLVFNDQS